MSLPIKKNTEVEITRVDEAGNPIVYFEGKPYTGMVHYMVGGKIGSEIEYKNGYEEGFQRLYHENGTVEFECQMKYGDPVRGSWIEWDEDGNIIADETKDSDT